MLDRTWNLELLRQGCDDVTGERRGELWILAGDGRFERVRMRPDGTGRARRTPRVVRWLAPRELAQAMELEASARAWGIANTRPPPPGARERSQVGQDATARDGFALMAKSSARQAGTTSTCRDDAATSRCRS